MPHRPFSSAIQLIIILNCCVILKSVIQLPDDLIVVKLKRFIRFLKTMVK